jgi:dienelactone hydrolase
MNFSSLVPPSASQLLSIVFLAFTSSLFLHSPSFSQTSPSTDSSEIKITEGWVVSAGATPRGRISLPSDPLEFAYLRNQLNFPIPDQDESPSAEGLPNWKKIKADEQGNFTGRELFGSWLACYVDSPNDSVWLLDAQGHSSVRINGTPRVGDVYSNGSVELPVSLKKGRNLLLFSSGRGRINARLKTTQKKLYLSQRDNTFPTLLRDERTEMLGALLVVNATTEPIRDLLLRVTGEGLTPSNSTVPFLPPLSTRKVPIKLQPLNNSLESWKADSVSIDIQLIRSNSPSDILDQTQIALSVRNSNQKHRRTFHSQIDGSVQYFGVVPPLDGSLKSDTPPSLILTLHGAGVEGEGQANVYAPKPNTYVIAPTNRRNFGFDWEDWGRLDAIEVLQLASKLFGTNPRRTYLTGHSMGGHGTWHIGTLFPDRFAAIGPSAGWISFSTYAGRGAPVNDDPVAKMLRRPLLTSDTLARKSNLSQQGVYILHGDADDNVPVDQARTMRENLATFHPDFVYKEQPGAGHWWGDACCDWPPLIQFFESHEIRAASDATQVDFVTPNPAVSASCFWATIDRQIVQCELSEIHLQWNKTDFTISGSTKNVQRLGIDTKVLTKAATEKQSSLKLDIDGSILSDIEFRQQDTIWLVREGEEWSIDTTTNESQKNRNRNGVFKEAFNQRFVLIYGTEGNADENSWMLDRARFDAETFWYRGNGSVDIIPDSAWKDLTEKNRNVIVYGNASINSVWREVLSDSPVQVLRDQWSIKKESENKESASILMIRPQANHPNFSIGAIGGTDLLAMRATNRIPIFSSGTNYPDLLIATPDFLQKGTAAIRRVGFFGNDWSIENGEWQVVAP